jgi:hypothetical protein
MFHAQLAGVSFLYEPIILPISDMGGIPIGYIEGQREINERAAKNSKSRFDEAVRRAGISSERASVGAAEMGHARSFSYLTQINGSVQEFSHNNAKLSRGGSTRSRFLREQSNGKCHISEMVGRARLPL